VKNPISTADAEDFSSAISSIDRNAYTAIHFVDAVGKGFAFGRSTEVRIAATEMLGSLRRAAEILKRVIVQESPE